jgi:uncharacterized protein (TIGR00299 family) protein
MRTLAFDGRTGASGDMLLGALVAAGADPGVLEPIESALDLEYAVESVRKQGVTATAVTVLDPDGEPLEGEPQHRSYSEVVDIVESLSLPRQVELTALGAFERLGRAEATIHGTALEDTHFHEVGADDAIADVVGVTRLVADIQVEQVITTPVAAGGGEVQTSHGVYPVPPPAVVEIADGADWSLVGGPVDSELLTPTGAALLAELAEGVSSLPELRIEASGYGAGDMDIEARPNVLRATVGDVAGELVQEAATVLETNLDDATPEVLGSLHRTLTEVGAHDVTVLPTTMKKARPGHLIKVIVDPSDAERVARRLAEETGTLGVREAGAGHRWIAERRSITATLREAGERHSVTVKLASDDAGAVYDVSAEFDDVAAVAAEIDEPVRAVMRRAETAARQAGALEPTLLHVIEADDWAAVDGEYAPQSLEAEGFIHLSPVHRVVGVAQYNHPDAADPQLLLIDRAAIENDLKYEEQPSGAFPHLYGPLPVSAVTDVVDFPRTEDGRYRLPDTVRPE